MLRRAFPAFCIAEVIETAEHWNCVVAISPPVALPKTLGFAAKTAMESGAKLKLGRPVFSRPIIARRLEFRQTDVFPIRCPTLAQAR
jgi:hypothetical protein